MIEAQFLATKGKLKGFAIKGHAGYALFGKDIVCASVSSGVMMTANTVTEILKIKADVKVFDNEIRCGLLEDSDEASKLIEGLKLHLQLLAEDYPNTIKVNISEV
ncbi:MAG: ribosomal-processing cysteine protease Prp [Oscillospiraceae bacterium]|nr:ribosomal-processing cysteine protease Prp [Oscillospiraceae bacterium]